MKKVAIIGAAGTLGSACAMTISMKESIDELCLIDMNESLLDNHIMDFENAFPSKRIYRGTYEDLRESCIVIITAGVPNRNDATSRTAYLTDNIAIFNIIGAAIAQHSPNALIITASNPVDILNFYLYKNFDFKREQLIGYTINDSYRFEWALRKILSINNTETTIISPVIGEHGNSQVPVFSQLKSNNSKLFLTNEQTQLVKDELKTWFVRFNTLNVPRTTGWTTGVGLSKLVGKLLSENVSSTIGSSILTREYGIHDLSIGVPLVVNSKGIHRIKEWNLTKEEQQDFWKSAKKIKTIIEENHSFFN